MSSCMYTAQGILLCNASNGSTSTKSDKEKMQTSFWNRIEQFNDSQLINMSENAQEPTQEPTQEPVAIQEPVTVQEPPKKIKIVR